MKYLKKFGISVEKRIHQGWINFQEIKKKTNSNKKEFKEYELMLKKNKPMGDFDKWQYIFTSKNGRISLIRLFDYYRIGEHQYEIFCLDNNEKNPTLAKKQLSDIRRFYKYQDAIKCIIELLRNK